MVNLLEARDLVKTVLYSSSFLESLMKEIIPSAPRSYFLVAKNPPTRI